MIEGWLSCTMAQVQAFKEAREGCEGPSSQLKLQLTQGMAEGPVRVARCPLEVSFHQLRAVVMSTMEYAPEQQVLALGGSGP